MERSIEFSYWTYLNIRSLDCLPFLFNSTGSVGTTFIVLNGIFNVIEIYEHIEQCRVL